MIILFDILLVASPAFVIGGICGCLLAEYYWITLPRKQACRLCGWMGGAGHAPQCSLWRPKPGELQTLAEEYAAEMADGVTICAECHQASCQHRGIRIRIPRVTAREMAERTIRRRTQGSVDLTKASNQSAGAPCPSR